MSPSSGKWWDRNPIGWFGCLSAGSAALNPMSLGCRPLAGSFMHSGGQPLPDGLSRRAGGCGGTGGAVNPSMGALAKHPCFAKPPYPRTRRPSRIRSVAMEDQTQFRSFPCVTARGRYNGSRLGTDPTLPHVIRVEPRPAWLIFPAARDPPSRGGRRAAPVGTVKNMDVFAKPPRVKAHCLRGTASRATERPAAGGWAGARRAVYGVSRKGLPVGLPST
jgi:hypothetical protein